MRSACALAFLLGCYAPEGSPPERDAPSDAGAAIDSAVCAGAADGTSCPGGRCRSGACCTGCWDGSSCLAGDANEACGRTGEHCQECLTGTCECDLMDCPGGDVFRPPGCVGGICDLLETFACCGPTNDGICEVPMPCDPTIGCMN